MTEVFFNSADELKEAFGIDDASEYEKYTPLKNRKAAFSCQRRYPKNIRYIPPKTKDKMDDTVALIHVIYTHPTETKEPVDSHKVPLILSITPYSHYLDGHFDYDFFDENCPTEESVRLSKSTPRPMGLDLIGEYFYDHHANTFLDKHGKRLTGKEILDRLFQLHCDTIHVIKGLRLRWKLSSQSFGVALCVAIIHVCKSILRTAFGRSLEPDRRSASLLKEYKKEDMKLLKTDTISAISVFGYKASRNVIITFCIIVLVAYTIAYVLKNKSQYVSGIVSNPFLVLCVALPLLWVLDHLVPNLLLWIINLFIRLRLGLMFMKINF